MNEHDYHTQIVNYISNMDISKKIRYTYLTKVNESIHELENKYGKSFYKNLLYSIYFISKYAKEQDTMIPKTLLVYLKAGMFYEKGECGFEKPGILYCLDDSLWNHIENYLGGKTWLRLSTYDRLPIEMESCCGYSNFDYIIYKMIFSINDENPTHIDSSIDYNEKVYQDIFNLFLC